MTSSAAGPRINLAVLDALRGVLALYVVLFHAWGLLWRGGLDPTNPSLSTSGLSGALGLAAVNLRFGHQAVLVFFLISGFCIHYRQALSLAGSGVEQSRLSLRAFAGRRARRLYPPLLAALVLTITFDYFGTALNPGLYDHTSILTSIQKWLTQPMSYSAATVAGNLLFLGGLAVPAFGSNGPIWSLSFEACFYLAYPMIWLISKRYRPRVTLAICVTVSIAAAAGYVFLPAWPLRVASYWALWAAGAVTADAYARRLEPEALKRFGPFSIAILAVLALIYWPAGSPTVDLLWCLPLSVAFAYLMLAMPSGARQFANRLTPALLPLGRVSYSLYLIHFPLFVLLAAWWLSSHAELPVGAELAVPGVIAALLVGASTWFFSERPFSRSHGPHHAAQPRTVFNWKLWALPSASRIAAQPR
jgi:peptidoglycan/LPS O-acetylase OafA/YrhL